MKKILSVILALVMLFSSVSVSAVAVDGVALDECSEHLFTEWELVPLISCTNQGIRERERRKCLFCGEKEYRYTGNFIEHDFIDWVVVREASCTMYGEEYRWCENCEEEQYRFPEATGHNYELVIVNPTCTEQGYTEYTCKCGDKYKDNFIEATGHNVNSHGYCDECIKNLNPSDFAENSLVGNDILIKIFEFIYVLMELLSNLV